MFNPKVGSSLYAITDQGILINLIIDKVTKKSDDGGDYVEVGTSILNSSTPHRKAHHSCYFKNVYFDLDTGEFDKSALFTCTIEALEYSKKLVTGYYTSSEQKTKKLLKQLSVIDDSLEFFKEECDNEEDHRVC